MGEHDDDLRQSVDCPGAVRLDSGRAPLVPRPGLFVSEDAGEPVRGVVEVCS